MVLSPDQGRLLLDAARETIRRTLRGEHPHPPPPCPDPALLQHGGCFVSLHQAATHRLRGCVGRIDAARPLWHAVTTAAVNVLDDPRFAAERVTLVELPSLDIEVSILSPMRPAVTPLEFDPEAEGIYLIVGARSGCFLPQVARETGWSREQLLARLCTEKLNLPPTAWRAPEARLMVFSTTVVGPELFGACSDETRRQAP